MFNPFGALTGFGGGVIKGYTEDYPKILEQMGSEALGRALQVPGAQPMPSVQLGSPQPPEPGQASTPQLARPMPQMAPEPPPGPQLAQRMPPQATAFAAPEPPQAGGSMFGGMPGWDPGERPIEMGAAPTPGAASVAAAPPRGAAPPDAGSPPPPRASGGSPRPEVTKQERALSDRGDLLDDVQSLAARIRAANPNISPAVFAAAMKHGLPYVVSDLRLSAAQAKLDLAYDTLEEKRKNLEFLQSQISGRQDKKIDAKAEDTDKKLTSAERIAASRNERITNTAELGAAVRREAIAAQGERQDKKIEADAANVDKRVQAQLDVAKMRTETQLTIADNLENGRNWRANLSDDQKREAAALRADTQKYLDGQKTERAAAENVAKAERQATGIEAKTDQQAQAQTDRLEVVKAKGDEIQGQINLKAEHAAALQALKAEDRAKMQANIESGKDFRTGISLEARMKMQQAGLTERAVEGDKNRAVREALSKALIDMKASQFNIAENRRERALAETVKARDATREQNRQRFLPETQDLIKRAEAQGFDSKILQAEAEHYKQTGDYSPRVKQMRGIDKNAVMGAVNKIAEDQGSTAVDRAQARQDYTAEGKAVQQFKNPNSQVGQQVRSLSVVQEHLKTLRQLADAYNPSEMSLFNKFAAYLQGQTGGTTATNLDTAASIVGTEIIKALGVRGAGTLEERRDAASRFGASAPEAKGLIDLAFKMAQGKGGTTHAQLYGNIDTAQELINGQLKGVKRQYEASTKRKDFEAMLTDTAQEEMKRRSQPTPPPPREPKKYFPGFGLNWLDLTPNRPAGDYKGPD